MSIESFSELMNDIHDAACESSANVTNTSTFVNHTVRDNDFNDRADALVTKSIFRVKVDKIPLVLKLSYRQFRDLINDANYAERRRYFSVRIYSDRNFSKFGITNLDAQYVQININKIQEMKFQNSHLLWILAELSVILARGGRRDAFFWNKEEHQEFLKLLEEAESLV